MLIIIYLFKTHRSKKHITFSNKIDNNSLVVQIESNSYLVFLNAYANKQITYGKVTSLNFINNTCFIQ